MRESSGWYPGLTPFVLPATFILLGFLILSGCSTAGFHPDPAIVAPSGAPIAQDPSPTPISLQRLRIVNRSAIQIQKLQVRFPDESVDFGDVPPGTASDYRVFTRGVYRYAAYDVVVEGQTYQQPVVDWIGENPLSGSAFTYILDVDPSRWTTEGQVIRLVEVKEDSASPATPTPSGLISRQAAQDAALKIASSSRPEISAALVTPQIVQAEAMTLEEALQRLHGSAATPSGNPPGTPAPTPGGYLVPTPGGYLVPTPGGYLVWLVTMEGLWASEASAPGVSPAITQQPYHFFTVILDARTGIEVESTLKP